MDDRLIFIISNTLSSIPTSNFKVVAHLLSVDIDGKGYFNFSRKNLYTFALTQCIDMAEEMSFEVHRIWFLLSSMIAFIWPSVKKRAKMF